MAPPVKVILIRMVLAVRVLLRRLTASLTLLFLFREKLRQKKLMTKKAKQESKNQAGTRMISYPALFKSTRNEGQMINMSPQSRKRRRRRSRSRRSRRARRTGERRIRTNGRMMPRSPALSWERGDLLENPAVPVKELQNTFNTGEQIFRKARTEWTNRNPAEIYRTLCFFSRELLFFFLELYIL